MYCNSCGKEIKQNIRFCPSCGCRVEEQNVDMNNQQVILNEEKIENNTGLRRFILESARSGIFLRRKCYIIEVDHQGIFFGENNLMEFGKIREIRYTYQASWAFLWVAVFCLPIISLIFIYSIGYGIFALFIMLLYSQAAFHRKIIFSGRGVLSNQEVEREVVVYSESEKDMLDLFDCIKQNIAFKGTINKGINIAQIVIISCSVTVSVLLFLIMLLV